MYDIIYSPRAVEDLIKLQRNEPAAFKKASKFTMMPSQPAPTQGSLAHSSTLC